MRNFGRKVKEKGRAGEDHDAEFGVRMKVQGCMYLPP